MDLYPTRFSLPLSGLRPMKSRCAAFGLALLLLIPPRLYSQEEARLLRFPAVHGNQIVFTYAGNLYSVPASGGIARRLTSSEGFECFPRFSPDGSQLAFTGQYDGNTEVYVMPAAGGEPRRVTITATLSRDDVSDRMGPNNIVMTWKDQSTIVYRSRGKEWNSFKGQLYSVPAEGGPSIQLPLPRGGFCSYSPDGKKLAYNRIFREFRTWKRYRGGQADDVWIYDFATKQTTNITSNPAQDIFPMWTGNQIYFLSDRDSNRRMNLFVYDLGTQQTKQLTAFTEYDIKFPSLGDNAIVFENGGYIYRFDLASATSQKVPIVIDEDFASGRSGLRDVSKQVTNYEISPDGSRALFGARGDVFTVPAKYGNTRNLTQTPGVHERNSKWSPDGRWISYISDATGEDEIWVTAQDGKSPARQVTTGGDVYKYQPLWSPDSKKLLWADKKLRLQFVDVATGEVTQVAQGTTWEFSEYSWSPDSKWIAYAQPEVVSMNTVQLYDLASKKTIPASDGWFDCAQPTFSADGKYLFFVSNRSFSPMFGQLEWNHIYRDMAKIYLLALARSTPSPFAPKSDEVKIASEENAPAKTDAKKEAAPKVTVDADGLISRITVLPVAAAAYRDLRSVGNQLFYIRAGSKDEKAQLLSFDFDKRKETELGEADGFEISADGKKMLVGQNQTYAIIDLPSGKIDLKERLNLSDMKVQLDRKAEWKQIFNECWRQMRDFMFDPHLHGVDWKAMKARYETLVPYVNHRADLTYIIGELIGELNIGHAYVGGGDYPKAERVNTGLLGAQTERDPATKYFRITKILKGQNWEKQIRSPLTEIGVTVNEGDYIIAVDGKPTSRMRELEEAFINTAGKQVTLRVNSAPREEGSHETVVIPTDDEADLYYQTWIEKNIDYVSKQTDGKVGYVHIPDMGTPGLNAFAKYYYPQVRKEALIVDVRSNGGGNVSPQVIERLRREIAMIDVARNSAPDLDPGGAVMGPKVLLLDEFSASDGDIVAYRFKKHHMGPIVGKRSWGGVVGIRGSLPLLDGGFLNRPEFSRYDTEGKEWIMEGHGVDPDIVVDNDPAREYEGRDDQLDKAIAVVKEEMKKQPSVIPPPPPYPDKNK
jgi:tricorn protease